MEFLQRASKLDTYGFDPYTVTVSKLIRFTMAVKTLLWLSFSSCGAVTLVYGNKLFLMLDSAAECFFFCCFFNCY